jgi:hypothetical protein
MGTVEDVEAQDHDTCAALKLVREAAKDDAFSPSVDSALRLHQYIEAAGAELRKESLLLRQTIYKLNDMDREAQESARSRAARPAAGPVAFAPVQAGIEGRGAIPEPPYVPPAHWPKTPPNYGTDPLLRVGKSDVMPKSQQELIYRRAAKRHGRM